MRGGGGDNVSSLVVHEVWEIMKHGSYVLLVHLSRCTVKLE